MKETDMKIPVKLKASAGRAARALTAALLVSPLADALRVHSKVDRAMVAGSVIGATEIAWRQLYPAPDAGSVADVVDRVLADLATLEQLRGKLDQLNVTHPLEASAIPGVLEQMLAPPAAGESYPMARPT